jgi:hypothetical protein
VQLFKQTLGSANLRIINVADGRDTATVDFREGRHVIPPAPAKPDHRDVDAIVRAQYRPCCRCRRHGAFHKNTPAKVCHGSSKFAKRRFSDSISQSWKAVKEFMISRGNWSWCSPRHLAEH